MQPTRITGLGIYIYAIILRGKRIEIMKRWIQAKNVDHLILVHGIMEEFGIGYSDGCGNWQLAVFRIKTFLKIPRKTAMPCHASSRREKKVFEEIKVYMHACVHIHFLKW